MTNRPNRRRGGHGAQHNTDQHNHNSHHNNSGETAAIGNHPFNPFKPQVNPFKSRNGAGPAHTTINSNGGSSSSSSRSSSGSPEPNTQGYGRPQNARKRNFTDSDRPYDSKSPRGDADSSHHRHSRAKHIFDRPPRRTAEDEFPMFDFIKDEPLPGKLAKYANEDTFYQARVTQLMASVNPEFRTPALESLLRLGDVERISAEVLHFLSAVMQCNNLPDVESHDVVMCDCNGRVPLCFMRAYMHEKLVSSRLRAALRDELKLSEERRQKSVRFLGDSE